MTLKLVGSSDGSVSLSAPSDTSPSGTDVTLTLPTSDGDANQVLQTDGSGALSWVDNQSTTFSSDITVNDVRVGRGPGNNNDSTVVGRTAGNALTSGETGNTFIGSGSGSACTTGDYNIGVGWASLGAGTMTGEHNIGIGARTGESLTTGDMNVCIGYWAGRRMGDADNNVFIGPYAAYYGDSATAATMTGDYNIGIGSSAMSSVTTGGENIGIGRGALGNLDTGGNNVAIGRNAGYTNSPAGSITSGSNILVLGDNSTTDFYCADTSISSSDQRDKADITDFTHGLDWITQMRPVTYKWDKRSWYNDWDANPDVDLLTLTPDGTHKKDKVNLGLLAQDVRAIEVADGFAANRNTQLVAYDNEDGKSMGVKYERLVPVLINAIKELKTEVDTLKTKVAALEAG